MGSLAPPGVPAVPPSASNPNVPLVLFCGPGGVSLLHPEPPNRFVCCTREGFYGLALRLAWNPRVLKQPDGRLAHEASAADLTLPNLGFPTMLLGIRCQLGVLKTLILEGLLNSRLPGNSELYDIDGVK